VLIMAKLKDHFRAADLAQLLLRLPEDESIRLDLEELRQARQAADDAVKAYQATVRRVFANRLHQIRPLMRPCHRDRKGLDVSFEYVLF